MSNELIHGDCLTVLDDLDVRPIMIFADPPDNLGLGYVGYTDKLTPEHYYLLISTLIEKCINKTGIFWLSYHHTHDLEVSSITRSLIRRHPTLDWNKFLWRYTFGQYRTADCASGYRPILRLKHSWAKLYPESIKVESVRQLLGDVRAVQSGRVPDNVWDFSRVVGNALERRVWHPTQHPEKLLERIIKFSTVAGDLVLDPFFGTGTTGRVCNRLERPWIGIERSEFYIKKLREEFPDCSSRLGEP